jgi:hypothetical protein
VTLSTIALSLALTGALFTVLALVLAIAVDSRTTRGNQARYARLGWMVLAVATVTFLAAIWTAAAS